MADILQITEDIPVDDSIYEYEYKEYNAIMVEFKITLMLIR